MSDAVARLNTALEGRYVGAHLPLTGGLGNLKDDFVVSLA